METIQELKAQIEHLEKLLSTACYGGIPVGAINVFAMPKSPIGWLVCDGQEYRIEDYKELYDTIGDAYSSEETPKGFFRIPNLQGQFIRGWDKDGVIDKERVFGSYQEDTLQGHAHELYMSSIKTKKDGKHNHLIGYDKEKLRTSIFDDEECHSLASRSDQCHPSCGDDWAIHEHELPEIKVKEVMNSEYGNVSVSEETRPKNIALLYCIKAK